MDKESYSENNLFEDNLSARLPVEGTIPRGYSLYDYEDTNEGYESAKKNLTNPYILNQEEDGLLRKVFNLQLNQMAKGDWATTVMKDLQDLNPLHPPPPHPPPPPPPPPLGLEGLEGPRVS